MHHLGIGRINQGAYFLNTKGSHVIHKFINQPLADALVSLIGVNNDGFQRRFVRNAILSYQDSPHYEAHELSIVLLRYERCGYTIR